MKRTFIPIIVMGVLTTSIFLMGPAQADDTIPCEGTTEITMSEVADPIIIELSQDIQPDVIIYGPLSEDNLINDLIDAQNKIVKLKAKIKALKAA